MKLLIHDITKEEFGKIADRYEGWEIISDNGSIKPCIGCFGCWIKTPGECVIQDGYNRMGSLIHEADEVVVMSRYTYGGLSSFVKNVIDRSISFVLPFFEKVDGEMHHKKRYPEQKPFTFIFRGHELTEEDRQKAISYVDAFCRNLQGVIKDVIFEECDEDEKGVAMKSEASGKGNSVLLLNCSLRGDNSNSKRFLDRLAGMIGSKTEYISIGQFLNDPKELTDKLETAGTIVLGIPLYVDGIPSSALRIMETMEKSGGNTDKNIYVVANMGFYESSQLSNLVSMVRTWCDRCGYAYRGALAIGAGEMLGGMMASKSIDKGPAAGVAEGFKKLANAIDVSLAVGDIYVNPEKFPRALYMMAANMGWPAGGRANGLKKRDLYRQLT